jgi:hypothetical protein
VSSSILRTCAESCDGRLHLAIAGQLQKSRIHAAAVSVGPIVVAEVDPLIGFNRGIR